MHHRRLQHTSIGTYFMCVLAAAPLSIAGDVQADSNVQNGESPSSGSYSSYLSPLTLTLVFPSFKLGTLAFEWTLASAPFAQRNLPLPARP